MFIFVSLCLFVLGAIIGSFLNVVIYRTANEEDWVSGRSKCEHCDTMIHWYDNIPLLSFLLLKGKCRKCHQTISLTHPIVELLTGTVLVWWYWTGTLFFKLTEAPFQLIQPLFWLIIALLFLIIIVTDFLYMIIPDGITISLSVLTLLYRFALLHTNIMQFSDFLWSLAGVMVGVSFFGSLWLATKGKGMGFGDVKLIIPIALLVGWPTLILQILLSFMIGAFVGVGLIIAGKKKFGQKIPFGPFMILATGISLLWGDQIIAWYLSLFY